MIRKLLTIVLPFLLPFVVYAAYIVLARRRARLAGQSKLPRWEEAPWLWIILAGVVLMAAALTTVRLTSGHAPGTELAPPRLIDGEIRPSHPVEPAPPAE